MRGMLHHHHHPPPSCYHTFENFSPRPQRSTLITQHSTLNALNELEGIKDIGVDLIGFGDGNVNNDDVGGGGGAAGWVLDFVMKRFEFQGKPGLDDAHRNAVVILQW